MKDTNDRKREWHPHQGPHVKDRTLRRKAHDIQIQEKAGVCTGTIRDATLPVGEYFFFKLSSAVAQKCLSPLINYYVCGSYLHAARIWNPSGSPLDSDSH